MKRAALYTVVVVLLAPAALAAVVGGTRCRTDRDCDDGVYCNGAERCAGRRRIAIGGITVLETPGRCRPAARGTCVATGGARAMLCLEEERRAWTSNAGHAVTRTATGT